MNFSVDERLARAATRRDDVRLPEFAAAEWIGLVFANLDAGAEKRESGVHHFHRLWAAAMEPPRVAER